MGAVALWSSCEAVIGVVTACVPNLLPLYNWAGDRIRDIRSKKLPSGPTRRSMAFENSRSPTYVEDDLTLRPKEEDEICLTCMATAKRHESEEAFSGPGIVVRSEVTQTVEDCSNFSRNNSY